MTIVIKDDYLVIVSDYSRGKSSEQIHIEQVDRETGEVMQGCMVYIPYRPRLTERWFMGLPRHIQRLQKDLDMTGETMKVLMYLFGKLDFENFIQQTQIDVAEGLGMRKTNVN